MTQKEIYDGLRLLVKTYITESNHEELLSILKQREDENSFPPGKGILSDMITNSNGIKLKAEHMELYSEICRCCV